MLFKAVAPTTYLAQQRPKALSEILKPELDKWKGWGSNMPSHHHSQILGTTKLDFKVTDSNGQPVSHPYLHLNDSGVRKVIENIDEFVAKKDHIWSDKPIKRKK